MKQLGAQITSQSPADATDAVRLTRALLEQLPQPEPNRTYRVGFSGGADSRALLELAVLRYGPQQVRAVHIDHGLQAASTQWAQHCRRVAAQLGTGFDLLRLTPSRPSQSSGHSPSYEAWARQQRYRYWGRLLAPGDRLLLAHHANDQIETVALRLLQGRVPRPMPAQRALGAGILLRPLLATDPALLRAFLTHEPPGAAAAARREKWIEDPSNTDIRFLRNRVRKQLLPSLEIHFSGVAAQFERCGGLTERLLAGFEQRLRQEGLAAQKAAGVLLRLPICGLGVQGLLSLLQLCGARDLAGTQARQALHQLMRGANQPMRLHDRNGRRLELWSSHSETQSEPELVVWRAPVELPSQHLVFSTNSASAQWDLEHGRLRVSARQSDAASADAMGDIWLRFGRPGDRLKTSSGRGRRLVELLRDAGIPRWARNSYPILVQQGAVVCVPGIRRHGTQSDGLIEASWHPTD